ncbi:DUF1614 domain-containing protein [Methanogenium cariaci]|uniref:DUF1614 domain-containing protein n=1 Tax=Methanogenium cariaci TaxID=2197 RepID=UPI002480EC07|nr:DUF1614 domain-containing protein [Methanogenium cariaci]
MRQYYFNPFSFLLIVVVILLILLFLPLLFLGVIGGAFRSLGFSGWEVILLIIASVIGSFINIPVTRIAGGSNREYPFRDRFGRIAAMHDSPDTTVAVNVGGVLIPLFVTLYLVYYILSSPEVFPQPLAVLMGGGCGNSFGGRHYARCGKGSSGAGYHDSHLYSAALCPRVWDSFLLW